jgi:hypothetical protein
MDRSKLFLYDGDTFEHEGLTFKVRFENDDDAEAPWERSDGHGVVSEWTRRDKRPGERVLSSDRNLKRYYDVQQSTQTAKRDGWGLSDEHKAELIQRLAPKKFKRVAKSEYHVENGIRQDRITAYEMVEVPGRDPSKPLTKGEITAEAVRRDFEYLQGWCEDKWSYTGVVVKLMLPDEDGDLVESDDPELEDALWGVETYDDYHMEQAYENASNILAVYKEKLEQAAREENERVYWEERDVETI